MYMKKVGDKPIHDDKYPELTIQMFFEFMRTAYQVNDSFDELSTILSANSELNWTELAKIDLNLRSPNEKNVGTEDLPLERPKDQVKSPLIYFNSFFKLRLLQDAKPAHNSQPHEFDGTSQEKDNKKVELNSNNVKSPENQSPTKKSKVQKNEALGENKEHPLAKLMKKSLSDILHEGLLDSVLPYMLPKPTVSQPIIKKPITGIEAKKTASLTVNLEKSSVLSLANKEKEKDRNKIHRKSLE